MIYDRIDVVIDGHALTARPIEFTCDEHKAPILATRYETTCPNCGQSLTFKMSEAYVIDNIHYLGCPSCGRGFVHSPRDLPKSIKKDHIIIITGKKYYQTSSELVDRGCPFVDPVEAGIFDPVKIK